MTGEAAATSGAQLTTVTPQTQEPITPGGPGQPLEPHVLREMENAFGHSFSTVRVYPSGSASAHAASLGYHGYTLGEHVVFAPGAYPPDGHAGRVLLAHELTHVLQQRAGRHKASSGEPAALEAEADTTAASVQFPHARWNAGPVNVSPAKGSIQGWPWKTIEEEHMEALQAGTAAAGRESIGRQPGTALQELGHLDRLAKDIRDDALKDGIITEKVHSTFDAAQRVVIASRPELRQGHPSTATAQAVAAAIESFYSALSDMVRAYNRTETRALGHSSTTDVTVNKYFLGGDVHGLQEASSTGNWAAALDGFNAAVEGLDHYIADRLRERAEARTGDLRQRIAGAIKANRGSLESGTASKEVENSLRTDLISFYDFFRGMVSRYDNWETRMSGKFGSYRTVVNEYFSPDWHSDVNSKTKAASGRAWADAMSEFESVAHSFDKFLKTKDHVAAEPTADKLERAGGLVPAIEDLLTRQPSAQRISAVFFPRDGNERNATPVGVALNLYVYREGNKWVLEELTSPKHPKVNRESGDADKPPPLKDLVAQLDSSLRFPKGVIHYQIPGDGNASQITNESVRLSEWLFSLGLVLTAIGLAIGTEGTSLLGTVLTISGVAAGAASAGADIYERRQQGVLTVSTLVLDLAMIAADIATIGQIGLGRVISAGPGTTGRMARLAVAATPYYRRLSKAFAATVKVGSGTALLAMGAEAWQAIDAIDKAPGSPADRTIAKVRLLTQLAGIGMLNVIAMTDAMPDLERMPTLVLVDVGGVEVAMVAERATIVHATTPGAPATTFDKVRFKLPPGELPRYLTANVTALTGEQATFLLEAVGRRKGSLVFGGSRVKGGARTGLAGEVVSDLDVGFTGLSKRDITEIMKAYNARFGTPSQARPIEHNWIFPGSKRTVIPEIVSPEEFFMRSGQRGPDGPRANKQFGPSGYILVDPANGTVEAGLAEGATASTPAAATPVGGPR